MKVSRWMLAITLAILAYPMQGKAQQPIGVSVGGGADSSEIVGQLKEKIGRTLGYGLNDTDTAKLSIDVSCLKLINANRVFTGYACHSQVAYFPHMGGLHTDFDGHANTFATCTTTGTYCTEAIFDSFIQGTQSQKLAEAEAQLDQQVEAWGCKQHR